MNERYCSTCGEEGLDRFETCSHCESEFCGDCADGRCFNRGLCPRCLRDSDERDELHQLATNYLATIAANDCEISRLRAEVANLNDTILRQQREINKLKQKPCADGKVA